jgi:metal-responsive CopG/Arc/MetJ family transcriptional regulator
MEIEWFKSFLFFKRINLSYAHTLDENMLKNIDNNLKKNNFSTRTEFIRDAIRDKLENLSKDELIQEFMKYKGKALQKTTNKQRAIIREEALEKMAREKGFDV